MPMYTITSQVASERRTAVVALSTTWRDFPNVWKGLLDEVYSFLETGPVEQDGHNVMLYKDDVPNVEVGVQVTSTFAPSGRVVPSVLPAGNVAVTVHRGPYQKVGEAHDAVIKWCAASGLKRAGPRWEVYGDWREDPAELETEVYYLLR